MTTRDVELLADRALVGLDDDEANELRALGRDGDDSYGLAAAAIDLATLSIQPMPAGLAERIVAERSLKIPTTLAGWSMPAPLTPEAPEAPVAPVVAPVVAIESRRRRRVVPWLAAAMAAVVLGGVAIWLVMRGPNAPSSVDDRKPDGRRARSTPAGSAEDDRAALIASGAMRIDWKATPDAPNASGDVVWSPTSQRGYMRFAGLPANDPTRTQYQLWIFDKTRDQAFPVDGGVFDVTSTGEVIVPIAAKLHVDDATLFAVTVERPGGVVVSKREHIVVTAARS